MRKTAKITAIVMSAVCAFVLSMCAYCQTFPDEYTVYRGESVSIKDYTTIHYNNQSAGEIKVSAAAQSFSASGELVLFNIIPVKEVNVRTTENKYVALCGNIFGVKFYTQGVVIIKCDNVDTAGGTVSPGASSGLEQGDTITAINGSAISSCSDMRLAIEESGGETLSITFTRGSETMHTQLTPAKTDNGSYKAGIWIRDSCAGLGTMTFYDPATGYFASLGHGICDSDTGELMPLESAEIVSAEINNITKGTDGSPGSINGYFGSDGALGHALINTDAGLYGTLTDYTSTGGLVEIANIQDVEKGYAQILCTLDDSGPQLYDIEITHVNYDEDSKTKGLEITATDERLLELTGGIVQGMSGSPILQNGKLVGAVTHVLVSDSNKGYGIFAQKMYEEIELNLMT